MQEIVIIKATRLQAWTPAKIKKVFGYMGGLLATFSSYGGLFATFFSFFGAFLLLFTSWWGPFSFLGLPPPPTKISAAPMIARRVREHASRKFFGVTAI